MNKHSLVSVIIPTYNRASLVGRAIQSVLAQTYEDFELIFVDDASTDNTRGIIDRFADPRSARNTGIKAARGISVSGWRW